ncbi:MAG: hypothetical protein EOP84_03610 [Verrucomicrobiaceae bacterium]|nr:MAG: hypothetical protein EOP84_03610 [Verrucomicrobiaceae bacterium]
MDDAATGPQATPSGLALASQLERLLQLPLDSPSDVDPWFDACAEVQAWLEAHVDELPFVLPPDLIFYFHDPDIRAKEPEYKEWQEQAIRHLIKQLRGEELPGIKLPWWRFW